MSWLDQKSRGFAAAYRAMLPLGALLVVGSLVEVFFYGAWEWVVGVLVAPVVVCVWRWRRFDRD